MSRPKGSTSRLWNKATMAMVGKRFGKLTAIEPLPVVVHSHRHWRFRCDCGTELVRGIGSVRASVQQGVTPACLTCGGLGVTCSRCHQYGHHALRCKTPVGKYCLRCEGYGWRRPEDGSPCDCGQVYRAEAVPARRSLGIGGQPWV